MCGIFYTNVNSAMPEVRGQLNSMAEPIPHVIRPLVRTHVYHPYFAADRQAETEVVTLRDADALAHRFKCSLKPRECYNRGHRTASSWLPR